MPRRTGRQDAGRRGRTARRRAVLRRGRRARRASRRSASCCARARARSGRSSGRRPCRRRRGRSRRPACPSRAPGCAGTCAARRPPAAPRVCRDWLRLVNAGVSRIARRMNIPTTTSATLAQKREPPSPGDELRVAQSRAADREDHRRQEQARGNAHLRPAARQAAPPARRVLDGHQHRPAPLAADAEPLRAAQHHEQHRRPHAERLVGRAAGRSGTSRRP